MALDNNKTLLKEANGNPLCRLLTQRANIPQRALTAVLSVSCVVAVLLNNSRMVFGPYLNGQSNPAERALRSALTAAQQVS